MRGAPNFNHWPDSVDGMWKIELLRWLGKTFHIPVLIETGTCQGSTCVCLERDFERIYTVELHPGLYEEARERLAPFPHIVFRKGDSRQELPMMIHMAFTESRQRGPILFWLDAHPSGDHTANAGDPLAKEVEIITDMCPDALIVVDDMIGIPQFIGQVSSVNLSGWHLEYRTGEIIMHREHRYSVPEFES